MHILQEAYLNSATRNTEHTTRTIMFKLFMFKSQLVVNTVNGWFQTIMCAMFKTVSNISTRTTRSNASGDLNKNNNYITVNGAHIRNRLNQEKKKLQPCVCLNLYWVDDLLILHPSVGRTF